MKPKSLTIDCLIEGRKYRIAHGASLFNDMYTGHFVRDRHRFANFDKQGAIDVREIKFIEPLGKWEDDYGDGPLTVG